MIARIALALTLTLGAACGSGPAPTLPTTLAECEAEGAKYDTLAEMPADVVKACLRLSTDHLAP